MECSQASSRWRSLGRGLVVAILALAVMVATEPRLAVVWDEGYTLGRLNRIRAWLQAVRDPAAFASDWRPTRLRSVEDRRPAPHPGEIDTLAKLFSPRILDWFWPFAREEPHGHPPFYAIVALAGDVLMPGWPELARARLGTMIAFSLAAGAIFAFLARRWGVWPGAVGAGAWLLHPHLFALGHYATYDALLSSLWVGATLAFASAVEPDSPPAPFRRKPKWRWVFVFGVLAGLACATKLTGWLLPIPLLAWTALYRSRRGFLTLLVGGLVALVALYAVTPPFWTQPVHGLVRFFQSNLSRGETIRIKTLFLGTIYETPSGSLPWYNTLVWAVIASPVGFLILALVGVVRAVRKARVEPFGMLVVANGAFLLVLRALPHTPGHDGVRQILPAFGCLALAAGYGASSVIERLGRWSRPALGMALVEGLASVALMMPVPLSYFSPIVGGLPGALALGMEPTYYWDAMTDDALARLDERTPPRRTIFFSHNPTAWFYRASGRLKSGIYPFEGSDFAWYVVQNRPGALAPLEQELIERSGPKSVLVSKFGVPLVWAFPASELQANTPAGAAREAGRR